MVAAICIKDGKPLRVNSRKLYWLKWHQFNCSSENFPCKIGYLRATDAAIKLVLNLTFLHFRSLLRCNDHEWLQMAWLKCGCENGLILALMGLVWPNMQGTCRTLSDCNGDNSLLDSFPILCQVMYNWPS